MSAPLRIIAGVDGLEEVAGTHLGWSGWHTVTQNQIDAFAEATGDRQWIHVDPERAAHGPFGTTIVHGYLTLSLVPMLVWQVYTIEGVAMSVNYGTEKVRFPAPVPVGSRLRAGVQVLSVVPSGAERRVTSRVTVEREGGEKPVCVADVVSVVYR